MMQEEKRFKIFLSPPFQSGKELDYIHKALETNWLAPGGQSVADFEGALRLQTGRKYCVALNSGTAALHLAYKVLGVQPGDYVICPSFGFVATANPIAYLGATPVFVDSERQSWNMDPQLLEDAIKDLAQKGIRPRLIIYTHNYGNMAQVEALTSLAKKHRIPIVEDAAEALGSKLQGKEAGCFGDIGIFSFNGNKVITTSGGGALVTDNKDWAEHARHLSTQARNPEFHFAHTEVGYNYQMSNISAALGLAQLDQLGAWVMKKRNIYERYWSFFEKQDHYETVREAEGEFSSRWLSVFLAPDSKSRSHIIQNLHNHGIESRRFWKPLHLLGIYRTQQAYTNGVSAALFERGFCLPSGVGLDEQQQSGIISIVRKAFKNF
jgi:dTDP-4-amino-4,6-dideoxygalactose transaminase